MSSDWTCHVKKEFFNNKSPSVWIKCSLSFHSHAIRYKWIFSLLSVLFCLLFCLNAIVDVVNQSPNSTHMWMCCWLYIPSDSESLMISNWCHCHLLFHFLRAGHGWFNVGRLSIGKKKLSPIDSLWRGFVDRTPSNGIQRRILWVYGIANSIIDDRRWWFYKNNESLLKYQSVYNTVN